MNAFISALWAEALKAWRSKVTLLTAVAVSILPFVDGLFMIILKDPEQARKMGLIGAKAQLAAGTADWPTYFYVLVLGTAMAGAFLFAFITTWVFGREFSDHTVKELLALPTPRGVIVGAKFVLIAFWTMGLALWMYALGLGIGKVVGIPGASSAQLEWTSFWYMMLTALLTFMLMPFVALIASAGRGYLPPLAWAIVTLALAQIAVALGWGEWFPWAVPALVGGLAGPNPEPIGMHSYVLVLLAFIAGAAATFVWWRSADQTR
jgi:ABC-2 type transport system permease protein